MTRATYLQITDLRLLQDWGSKLRSVFHDDLLDGMPYLVGSALVRSDYRDVDVRLILSDDEIQRPDANAPAYEWHRYDRLCDRRRAVLEREAHANGDDPHANGGPDTTPDGR